MRWVKMVSGWHYLPATKPWEGELEFWCGCLGVMADVEVHSSGRAWALYGEKHGDHLVHSSPLGYTYRKLNFIDTKLDTNEILFFFFFRVRSM